MSGVLDNSNMLGHCSTSYMTKPIVFSGLLVRARALTRRSGAEIEFADLSLDPVPKRDAQQNFFAYNFAFVLNPVKKNHPRTEYLMTRMSS